MQETLQARTNDVTTGTQVSLLDKLRTLVLSGEYPPGAPLPELFLAEEFDVSRTPVREALKQLENEGLVDIRPKVGTFVRIPTRREIVELFQLKESLEGLAASLLARRGPVPELDRLKRNIEASELAERQADSARYAELVHEFHWTIVNGSDNSKLREHYGRLMNQLAYHRIVLETVERPARMRASIREHQSVIDAILEKDPTGAELAMRGHVNASSLAAARIEAPAVGAEN